MYVIFRAMAQQAESLAADFNAQSIVHTLWAFATMGEELSDVSMEYSGFELSDVSS